MQTKARNCSYNIDMLRVFAILIISLSSLAVCTPARAYPSQSHIESEIQKARACIKKSDCTGPIGQCPFGCSQYVNKKEVNRIRELMQSFPKKCEYKCKATMGYDCVDGLCTAKVTLGEIFAGAKCEANSDCERVDCARFDSEIKAPFKPECIEVKNSQHAKECRCMCRGCH